jgi:hypothetical protein
MEVLKFTAVTVTAYLPGIRLGTRKTPSLLVVILLVIPVSSFFTVTCAFGIAAPEESTTEPVNAAPATCASAEVTHRTHISNTTATVVAMPLFILSDIMIFLLDC